MLITVKNWHKFQSYRKSKPTEGSWKKLHKSFFSDFHVLRLSEQDRFRLLGIYVNTDLRDGTLEIEMDELKYLIGCKSLDLSVFSHFITVEDSTGNEKDSKGFHQEGKGFQRIPKDSKGFPEENRKEVEVEKKRKEKSAFDKAGFLDKTFTEFWELYPKSCPRKVDKKACASKWLKVATDEDFTASVMVGLAKAIKSSQWCVEDGKYIPAPLTFLNRERWNDEYDIAEKSETTEMEGLGL